MTTALAAAWTTARLTRTKRLPTLRELLQKEKKSKRLSEEEMAQRRAEFQEMCARMGT